MPSIRTLKIFLTVARHGTFAAAGNLIGLTPAAVGLQIRALAEDLHCQLFDRTARAAILNPTGRSLVPEFEALVRQYEALAAGAGHGNDGLSGTVVIGALVSALMGAFADALWTIKREHPHLDVRLLAGFSADFAARVEGGKIDAAIVTQSPRPLPKDQVWTELYTEMMVLIVPRHPHFSMGDDFRTILNEAPFMRFDQSNVPVLACTLPRAGLSGPAARASVPSWPRIGSPPR